jgi:phosphoribosylformylglycinamidine synthase subunit PurL
VNAFALGLMRKESIFYAKAAGVGNPVIYVGSKTGRDGIHGATMASEEFSEGSEAKRPNVQVGDPFMEKLLLEACVEAMESGAVVGIQDMGAAGLTCSTCEMGGRGGVGIEIELDRVPQRETGMSAYEIMLSESQERMLLVADKGREDEVLRIFAKWGLDGVVVGQVIAENKMRVLHHGEVVAEINNPDLTDEAPVYQRPVGKWEPPVAREMPSDVKLGKADLTNDLKKLLAAPNVASMKWVYQQYDSMVQTNTVAGPGRGDAGVIRVKDTSPLHARTQVAESKLGLAMALDGNGRWCWLDPKLGAMHAVAEACRNVACTGATPVAATNCLNFGNPEKPPIMAQFAEVIDGMSEACLALGTPITGGNVSFYNETLGEGIYPTPVMGIVGVLQDVAKRMTPEFKQTGRTVMLVHGGGKLDRNQAETRLGSSEYAKEVLGAVWGLPPELDLKKEAAVQKCLISLVNEGLIESAHDCSDGGLAVTLAEAGFLNKIGAQIHLKEEIIPAEILLFSEDASRVVVSCEPAQVERIREVAIQHGAAADVVGQTVAERLTVQVNGKAIVSASISELYEPWATSLEKALHPDVPDFVEPVLQRS